MTPTFVFTSLRNLTCRETGSLCQKPGDFHGFPPWNLRSLSCLTKVFLKKWHLKSIDRWLFPKKTSFTQRQHHRNIWKATISYPKKLPPYTTSFYPAQRHRETGRVSRWYIPKRWRHQNLRVVRLTWVPSRKTHSLRWKRLLLVAFWKRFPWAI